MRRAWICLWVVVSLSACARLEKPRPNVAASDAPATVGSAAEPPNADAPASGPSGPDAVRCGVHDGPTQHTEPKPAPPEDPADEEAAEKARLGNSAGRGTPPTRTPLVLQPPEIPGNAPLDPGISVLIAETLTRDTRPLPPNEEPGETRHSDVSACGLTSAQHGSEVALEIGLAATGLPYASVARGSALTLPQRRCLAELGCRVSLRATAAQTLFTVRGTLAHTPARFVGDVWIATEGSAARPVSQRAAKALDTELRPLARACVAEHPPFSELRASLFTKVDATGRLVPLGDLPGDAAGAILGCVRAKLVTLPPLPKTVLPGTILRTGIHAVLVAHVR